MKFTLPFFFFYKYYIVHTYIYIVTCVYFKKKTFCVLYRFNIHIETDQLEGKKKKSDHSHYFYNYLRIL